jgi:Zn-dependent protease
MSIGAGGPRAQEEEVRVRPPPLSRGSIRLGALAGVEIRIHWSWAVIAVLLTASIGLAGLPVLAPGWGLGQRLPVAGVVALLFFASLLLHELAHALMARRRGLPVHGITLFLFGGVSMMGAPPRRPLDEFLIAVVGPLASFALMFVFGGLYALAAAAGVEVAAVTFFYVALVNLMIGAFNLLPGFPLDGGRILRSALWGLSRNLHAASRAAAWLGRLFSVGFMALGAWLAASGTPTGLWMAMMGIFLWVAASPRTAATA